MPTLSCIPYIGLQEDIMEHMSKTEMVPGHLVQWSKRHVERMQVPKTAVDFAAMSLAK